MCSACRCGSSRHGPQTPPFDAIVGAWRYLIIGIRQDVRIDRSTDGVLTNHDGSIRVSAFEADCTLIRAYGRFAAALGKPVGPSGDPINAVCDRLVDRRGQRREQRRDAAGERERGRARAATARTRKATAGADARSDRLTLDATTDEMADIATSRTLATGRLCCVVGFTGSDRARVIDTGLTRFRVDADSGRYGARSWARRSRDRVAHAPEPGRGRPAPERPRGERIRPDPTPKTGRGR
jgi:hypothetical protein